MLDNLDDRLHKSFHKNDRPSPTSIDPWLASMFAGVVIFAFGLTASYELPLPHPLSIQLSPIVAAASLSRILFGVIAARVTAILAIVTIAILAYPGIYQWGLAQWIWVGAFIIVFVGYLIRDPKS